MRRLLATGLGFGLTVSASPVFAQQPARSPVRIVGVRSADEPALTVRAQASNLPLPPMGTPFPMPMPGTPTPMPMPMGATPLGMPKPLGQGPNIREVPGAAAPQTVPYQAAPYPGATLGPVYGMPHEGAHPTVVHPQTYGTYPAPQLDAPLFDGCYSQPTAGAPYGAAAPGFGQLLAPYGCEPNRWWLSAEYLLWFAKRGNYPPLLTTSSPAFAGILGTGDTRVLLGNGPVGESLHHGGRFALGRYFGLDQRWAVDGSVFFLGQQTDEFRASSLQFPVLARPFNNLNQGIPFSELVTSPGLSVGAFAADVRTELWGADLNIRRRLAGSPCYRLDLIGGFKYLNLSEELRVTETFSRTADSNMAIGEPTAVSGTVFDSFRTENHFFGGTVGLAAERRRGRWFASLTGKVALGTVEQQVLINGGQTIAFNNGGVGSAVGGLLAVPGNIGSYSQNRFAVVPEVGFNLGYQITPHCRMFVGYNFLYLSNALRPGDQIDPNLDVTRIPNFPVPNATRLPIVKPTVPLRDTDFYAQGVNFGLQWRW